MARPGWKPTEKDKLLIKLLRAGGKEVEAIAKIMGVCDDTLKKYCSEELDTGKDEIDSKIMGALVKAAVGGNTTAQIFYLKTRCGWRETTIQEITGKDGGPLTAVINWGKPPDATK